MLDLVQGSIWVQANFKETQLTNIQVGALAMFVPISCQIGHFEARYSCSQLPNNSSSVTRDSIMTEAVQAMQTSGVSGVRVETQVDCSECGIDTTVPFKPTGKRPMLCSSCFSIPRQEFRWWSLPTIPSDVNHTISSKSALGWHNQ